MGSFYACDCKGNKYCQVYPGAERNEDGVEEAGGNDMAVEMRSRSLSTFSKILRSQSRENYIRNLLVDSRKA